MADVSMGTIERMVGGLPKVMMTRPGWVKPHLLIMVVVFFGALGVGYLLLPDDNERIAMLERDGHDGQALQLLEQRFANGDRKQRTLFQLQNLYEEKGDLPKARQMLVLLAAARPRDANVQRRLAEFYRSTQDEAGYIQALEARLARRYSQPVCKELIGLYRRSGQFDAEQRTIAACRIRGYRRTEDIVRLAHLTAADGNMAEVAALLRSVDDRRRLKGEGDRLMLFVSLLEAGGADEAKTRAVRWYKGSRDQGLVLRLIDVLVDSNRHDLAMELAREVGRPGDAISLTVAELMLDRDQVVAARSYLKGWFEVSKLREPEAVSRFIRAALDAEDPLLAYKAGELHGLSAVAQGDLVALAEALSAVDQREAFQAVKAQISPELIASNALLAAAVEVDQGKPEPARQLLSRVEVNALDAWRLQLWARLMTSTGRRATAVQTLRDIAAGVANAGQRSGAPTPGSGSPTGPNGGPLQSPAPVVRPDAMPLPVPPRGQSNVSAEPAPPKLIRKTVRKRRTTKRPPRRNRLRRPPASVIKKPAPPPTWNGLPASVPFPAPG
ncbi:MAG: hypothetical protein R3D67_22385 [Hyphomicrobiaceae bacterium]